MALEAPKTARHRARKRALQALYQWQYSEDSAEGIIAQFFDEQDFTRADPAYFETLVRGVIAQLEELDAALTPYLDRAMAQVDPVERAILRLGAYELRHSLQIPWRVVLDEAVELAHTFGAEGGHAFVNGVLDPAARAWRTPERGMVN